jgi:hypothetical protein
MDKKMNYKDTILSHNRINEIDLKNAESNFTDALWDVAEEQAKVSFATGIKEVVGWVEKNIRVESIDLNETPIVKWYFNEDTWRAKLKEWGIND